MQKKTLTNIVLILLAIAAVGFLLYKCSGGFKEGVEDAKKHKEAQ